LLRRWRTSSRGTIPLSSATACRSPRISQLHVRFFVASLDGEPVGCAGVALFEGFAEVKRMYVRP